MDLKELLKKNPEMFRQMESKVLGLGLIEGNQTLLDIGNHPLQSMITSTLNELIRMDAINGKAARRSGEPWATVPNIVNHIPEANHPMKTNEQQLVDEITAAMNGRSNENGGLQPVHNTTVAGSADPTYSAESRRIQDLESIRNPQNSNMIDAAIKLGTSPEAAAHAIIRAGLHDSNANELSDMIAASMNSSPDRQRQSNFQGGNINV